MIHYLNKKTSTVLCSVNSEGADGASMIPGHILHADTGENLIITKETIVPKESDRCCEHVGNGFGHLPELSQPSSDQLPLYK